MEGDGEDDLLVLCDAVLDCDGVRVRDWDAPDSDSDAECVRVVMRVIELVAVHDAADGVSASDPVALSEALHVLEHDDIVPEREAVGALLLVNEAEREEEKVADGVALGEDGRLLDAERDAVVDAVAERDGLWDGLPVDEATAVEESVREAEADDVPLVVPGAVRECDGVLVLDFEGPECDSDAEEERVGPQVSERVAVWDPDGVEDLATVALSEALRVRDRDDCVHESDTASERLPVAEAEWEGGRDAEREAEEERLRVQTRVREAVVDTVRDREGLPGARPVEEADRVGERVRDPGPEAETVVLCDALADRDGLSVADAEPRDGDNDVERVPGRRGVGERLVVGDAEDVADTDAVALARADGVCDGEDGVADWDAVAPGLRVGDREREEDGVAAGEVLDDGLRLPEAVMARVAETVRD